VADVEVSHAEWFPKLVIGGSLGFQAQEPGDIFTGASLMAGLAPAISWRILDGGRVQAQIDASDARREQVALAYERAVLQALSDAERALGNYRYAMDAVTAQQQATDSATRAAQSAARRFELGDIGIAELLDAQQRAKEAQEQGVRQRSNALNEMVSLYKALGGEW
jgi:outer membrane protein TolC